MHLLHCFPFNCSLPLASTQTDKWPPLPVPQKGLDRVPVTDAAGRCVGVISRSDLFWALVRGGGRAVGRRAPLAAAGEGRGTLGACCPPCT